MELSDYELCIIKLVSEGLRSKDIGKIVGWKEDKVKHDLVVIYDKLGFSNRVELALWYIKNYQS